MPASFDLISITVVLMYIMLLMVSAINHKHITASAFALPNGHSLSIRQCKGTPNLSYLYQQRTEDVDNLVFNGDGVSVNEEEDDSSEEQHELRFSGVGRQVDQWCFNHGTAILMPSHISLLLLAATFFFNAKL